MKTLLFLLTLLPLDAYADGFQVFGIKSDYTMKDEDARYRDVYVNMGTSQGLKKGSQLDAFRTVTTVDELNHRVGKNISYKIAKLKIIHADSDVSVARVLSMEAADVTPVGSYASVMVGDRVEAGSK
ncbi:MAG: hypothetical protein EOP11_08035 [Proteobacteria bacterium]|nr:MAG: hypothetical protein EOP11_08035 [Pseudomonadota bacterium]